MNNANSAEQLKGRIAILATATFVVLLAAALLWLMPFSYLYCLAAQDSWLAAKTERELDGRIRVYYTKNSIVPKQSMWGWHYSLRPGERMVQYLIFGKEPLDVVFDSDSHVIVAFTSYE